MSAFCHLAEQEEEARKGPKSGTHDAAVANSLEAEGRMMDIFGLCLLGGARVCREGAGCRVRLAERMATSRFELVRLCTRDSFRSVEKPDDLFVYVPFVLQRHHHLRLSFFPLSENTFCLKEQDTGAWFSCP